VSELKYTDVMKPEEISIEKCWKVFASLIFEGEISRLQYDEMRKSFYAGFTECFKIMNDLSTELTEDQAVQNLDRIRDEAREFYEQMKQELFNKTHCPENKP